MLDTGDVASLVSLGCDVLIAYGLYKLYKYRTHSVEEVKKAENFVVGQDLLGKLKDAKNKTIEYACVEGIIEALGRPVCESQYKDKARGVIKNDKLIEHASKRYQGHWSDVKNVIQDLWEVVPFYLKPKFSSDHKVHVLEARSAEYLERDLSVTYDHFQPKDSNLLQKGVDRLFGEVIKGYQVTEKMLLVGTPILGIGTLILENGEVKLSAPEDGRRYILTTRTKTELLKHLSRTTFILKILVGVLGVVGIGLLVYILRRFYKKLKHHFEMRQARDELLQARERHIAERAVRARTQNVPSDTEDSDSINCVVCLTNPREVVLLNCGHICLCADCVLRLPEPKLCPVCREDVIRYVATYIP